MEVQHTAVYRYGWTGTLLLLFLVVAPLIFVAVMSFCQTDQYYNVLYRFSVGNYIKLLNADYVKIYGQSIIIALLTTILCILIGYPFSYIIARTKSKRKQLLYMLVIIPFWTNSLIRIYGWRTLLGTNRVGEFHPSVSSSDKWTAGSFV